MVTEHKRDLLENGVAKRLVVGFKQPQGGHSENSIYIQKTGDGKRLCLPFFNTEEKKLNNMRPELKAAIGKIATDVQQFTTNRVYPGRVQDQFRNELFGSRFAALWGGDCECDFEFVDLFLESGSMLGRHMDYSNGKVDGYDCIASYSYCITLEDESVWRQNIILTHRTQCDASMKKLDEAGINSNNSSQGTMMELDSNN